MAQKAPPKKETSLRLAQLATFNEIGKALTSTLDLKEILNIVMQKVGDILQPKNWSLLLVDEEKKELRFEIIVGKGSERLKKVRLKLGEGIAGWVAMEKRPLLVPDVAKDPRFCKRVDEISKFKTRSIICVPLVAKGRCLGVIELINTMEDKAFTEEDLVLLTTVSDYTAIAIENAQFFNEIRDLTITDDLTKLYNSRHLHSQLEVEVERARRFKYSLSMLFLDLDYFKTINDTYGHLSGSKLLTEVAQLLKSKIRTVDMAFRYGGDEFIVVMPETPKKSAMLVAEKLRDSMREHIFLKAEGINCRMTASFGVASYPDDATNKNDLIHMADEAMYRVKNTTRDGVAVA